jgi:FtsH-binding integral membrane protein
MTAAAPRFTLASVGAALLGIAFIIGALLGAAAKDAPPIVLTVCIILGGVIELGVGHGVSRGSRGAWALGVAMHGVLAVVALFALPALFRAGVPRAAGVAAVVGLAVMFVVFLAEKERDQRSDRA